MKLKINGTKYRVPVLHDVEKYEVIRPSKIPNAVNNYFIFFIC